MFKKIYYDEDKKCCIVEDDNFFIESQLELIDWPEESNFREHEFIQGINLIYDIYKSKNLNIEKNIVLFILYYNDNYNFGTLSLKKELDLLKNILNINLDKYFNFL